MRKEQKPRPWKLQYQWKSLEDFDKYCIRSRKDNYTPKWFNGASQYQDLEHAKKRLYMEFVEPYFDAIVGGRNWRIINKETDQVYDITIENKQIILT